MVSVKFRAINRADAIDELHNVEGVPGGLRQLASDAINNGADAEIEVMFSFTSDYTGVTASMITKVLGPPKRLPMTYTRDQIVEVRNQGQGIYKG